MRLLNPSPYMFFCDHGDLQVVGSSPEALVKVHGGRASSEADRGHAAARRRSQTQDLAHEQSLLADVKENAEHVMLVDLARNDLGRVARRRIRLRRSVPIDRDDTVTSCTS